MAIYYLDPDLGIDSGGVATNTPLGWWSLAFTAGTGVAPTADVVCSNNSQSAKLTVCVISSGTFAGNNAAGTLYFYGKTGAFAAGSITWTGGSATIAADANYNPWKTISSTGASAARMAPGDTVRIKQSPPPTSLGVTGKWTSTARAAGGFDAALTITATANNGSGLVRLTMASTATLANGDVVQVLGIVGTVEANGSWVCTKFSATQIDLQASAYSNAWISGGTCQKITSKAVVLSGSFTQTLHNCDVNNWVGAGDGTPSLVTYATDAKEGQGCIGITMDAATQANVLQSYAPISISAATANNYNCISFWIKNSAAIATATTYTINLCSDANGTVVLDTFVIPAIPSVNQWVPLTIARSGNGTLGNNGATAIASIAVKSGTTAPTNSSNILIDNIIATKTGSLNLQSLISLNSSLKVGAEGWYGIQSINKDGTIVLLDNGVNTICNAGRGYFSATPTTTATTYIRETFKTSMATIIGSVVQNCQESGSSGNIESYEGGYDTATNTQIGETFFDGLNGFGYGLYLLTAYNSINYLNFCRYGYGLTFGGASTYNSVSNVNSLNNNSGVGLYSAANNTYNTIGTIGNINNNSIYGFWTQACTNLSVNTIGNVNNNMNFGVIVVCSASNIGTISNANNNTVGGIECTALSNLTITDITNANYNGSYGIYIYNNVYSVNIGTITNANYNGSRGVALSTNAFNNTIGTIINANYNVTYGVSFDSASNNRIGTISNANYNAGSGLYFGSSHRNTIKEFNASSNTNRGVAMAESYDNKILSMSATGHTAAVAQTTGVNYIRNANLAGTEFASTANLTNSRIYSEKHDQVAGSNYVYTDNGTITSEAGATYGHSASGICWKLAPTSANRDVFYPLILSIAKVAVSANKLVTVKAWMKLTSTTDILGALVCRSGQLAWSDGTADIQVNMSTANTNYNEVTLTCTPTEAGVLEFEAWAWWVAGGATQSVYIDDLTITQAA